MISQIQLKYCNEIIDILATKINCFFLFQYDPFGGDDPLMSEQNCCTTVQWTRRATSLAVQPTET